MSKNNIIYREICELKEIIPRVFHSLFWQSPEYILKFESEIDFSSKNPLLFQIFKKDKTVESAKIFLFGEPSYSQEDSHFAITFRMFWKSVLTHRQNLNMSTGKGSGKIAKVIQENLSEYENVSTFPNLEDLSIKYKHANKSFKPCAACASQNTLLIDHQTHSDANGTANSWEIYCLDCRYTSVYTFNDKC